MRDTAQESEYYPREPLGLSGMTRVLCLAPHPDDEVIGCGGLLAALMDHGRDVLTIVLTDGQAQAESGHQRRPESIAAAQTLGLPEPMFWGLEDRSLRCTEALISRLTNTFSDYRPSHVLVPSLSEPHPDHQALALATMAACANSALTFSVLFYEAGAPMVPNRLFDFAPWAERKWKAMECFASQEQWQGYREHAQALARLRGHGFGTHTSEAFFEAKSADLRREGGRAAQPVWPVVRLQHGLANGPEDLPRVSVLIRSMDRPSLVDALQAVALQTYPNIETLVIAACGASHRPLSHSGPHQRLVFGPGNQALGRSAAANLGLASASGPMALFLDDDDLLDPHHIERLVSALTSHHQAPAAYAGVRVLNAQGDLLQVYDQPWSPERLAGINFLPIQAVLFRVDRALEAGLQVREDLPVLEDWDFWHRLSELGAFVHVPGVSASYRKLDTGSQLGDPEGGQYWRDWHLKLLRESVQNSSPEVMVARLLWHALTLDELTHASEAQAREQTRLRLALEQSSEQQSAVLQAEVKGLGEQLTALAAHRDALEQGYLLQVQQALQDRDQLRSSLEQQVRGALADRDRVLAQLQDHQNQLTRMRASKSWRWTEPLRALGRAIRGAGPSDL